MDFIDRIRGVRREGDAEGERREHERELAARKARENAERVRSAAEEIGSQIERRLREFQSEFVEFRYEAFTREGSNFRVFWDEPGVRDGGRPERLFHQLSFQVRSYPEYGDVEVISKAIVRNQDRRRRSRAVDVCESDAKPLLDFVDDEVLEFTRLYSGPDPRPDDAR